MKRTKMIMLIEKLLKQGTSTAGQDVGISNANQYYIELENMGIVGSQWVYKDGSKYKERFIRDKAKAYAFLAKQTKKIPKAKTA